MAAPAFHRKLRRLYSNQDLSSCETVLLPADEARHALRVLRLQVQDHCLIVNGAGWEAEAVLVSSDQSGASFQILSRRFETRGFSLPVVILPSFIKKGKMDGLVEKAQEFGAAVFRPLICEYSDFEVGADRFQSVAERWLKIAREAAKQSGATQVLDIQSPLKFQKALDCFEKDALILIFHPHEPAEDWTALARKVVSEKRSFSKVYVLIGPEGGFSPDEIESAVKLQHEGVLFVKMGSTVLKADTAFIAALAGISFFITDGSKTAEAK